MRHVPLSVGTAGGEARTSRNLSFRDSPISDAAITSGG
jgi:hypothetical protein